MHLRQHGAHAKHSLVAARDDLVCTSWPSSRTAHRVNDGLHGLTSPTSQLLGSQLIVHICHTEATNVKPQLRHIGTKPRYVHAEKKQWILPMPLLSCVFFRQLVYTHSVVSKRLETFVVRVGSCYRAATRFLKHTFTAVQPPKARIRKRLLKNQ